MLSASEFTIGTLANATPLSLLLPRTRYEEVFLIGRVRGEAAAICLSGQSNFHMLSCSQATNWSGILIPNVQIEVDENSAFDEHSECAGPGTVVRCNTQLAVLAIVQPQFGRVAEIVLEADLPPTAEHLSASFSKWRVVLGEGLEKRVLREISVETSE